MSSECVVVEYLWTLLWEEAVISVCFNSLFNGWFYNQVILHPSVCTDIPQTQIITYRTANAFIRHTVAQLAPCSWPPDCCILKLPNLSWILWLLYPSLMLRAKHGTFSCVYFFSQEKKWYSDLGNKRNRCPKNITSVCFTLLSSQMKEGTV